MIGKNVWSKYGDHTLRFGKIAEEKIENGWVFVRVDWVDDHAFNMDRQRLISLRGVDSRSDWSRIDKLSFFEKDELVSKINKL
jgi:hypothetical protein|tara:strand:- start:68 stop:316 length:249 start_codon:yes stop_codon:yes gene_type:complete